MESVFKTIVTIIRFFVKPKEHYITYHSFPDLSDNSFTLFTYIINNHNNYKNVWLVNEINVEKQQKQIANYTNSKNYIIVKKKSLKGFYLFCKSKYVFYTHGMFNEIPLTKKQFSVNLWHGMPLKNIGYLDNNNRIPKSNYVISTSKLFSRIMSKAFDINLSNVLNTGQPRNDFLLESKFDLTNLINPNKSNLYYKTILWMPTYRKSNIGDIRIDGEVEKTNDFLNENYLNHLNNFLLTANFICYIKLHPMDFMTVNDFKTYTNIQIIDNKPFIENGISLYSILNNTDLLITDFSSIYIDYLLINKPILFVISDFEAYSNTRGFVFDNPKEYMPGKIISNQQQLIPFLEKVLVKNQDNYKNSREKIENLFHDKKDSFSKNVFYTVVKNK
jgi:CDP-glycerol glycerophosphotransferase (TagB/SpsB family)